MVARRTLHYRGAHHSSGGPSVRDVDLDRGAGGVDLLVLDVDDHGFEELEEVEEKQHADDDEAALAQELPHLFLVPHAVLAIRCRRPDERGRSISRAHVLLVCIHVLHLQAARTEVVQQVVQQRGARATVALVHVPACCESCECPLGVSWACPTLYCTITCLYECLYVFMSSDYS